ncbi:gamma-glutamyltransferase family protein [Leptolyngbya sp. FACHB-321]|uniref:gamma-glutamyltransferase family protein n=1 Tax=Leptolyngbya sp. FACHB-321 TaxID=2692807 RepID=UPI001683F06D|nr:gamma-glutamyltransferase family protein [Leptolyngbya sp. FACHB-321]MBD2034436.1 gamma-glutamyltransferase family protein [Leptolyngbya sp. FACHB-321]
MCAQNLTRYPYPSGRRVVMGKRGAIATSQPLAALAGMEMLWQGGNAVDAALATAIALTVVEPTSNGIGSDAFALVWDGKLHGLNASGRSAQALTLEHFAGMEHVPQHDWLSVTVPGAVSAWRSLWERWGRLPFEQLFTPAIRYAEEGYPVSPETALAWKQAEKTYLPLQGEAFQAFKEVFFLGDRAPAAGEVWHSPAHAETLRTIAQSGGDSFYTGALAEKIAAFAAATGGLLTQADFAIHRADWVEPIATDYRGTTVWEIPPNGQGIAALMALNLLEGFDLSRYPRESTEVYHWQIEAMKLAFADAHRYVADAGTMTLPPTALLSRDYARERRSLIRHTALPLAEPGLPKGGTVYLAASDGELMVSFIQSNYMGFGSGILVPGTGIALHNRATGFTLEAGHPNQIAPNKRPFHTIIPGFLTRDGQPLGPFGVMGAAMQPQGHLQVVVNLVDYGMNPQAALDAPRWQFIRDNLVLLEPTVSPAIATALVDRGHTIRQGSFFGRGQMILSTNGVLVAASEPRADGLALAW